MITAKVIEDSVCVSKSRLTTMVLSYPRWIHAEFMTHRVFSRNAASSRAIPIAKMIDRATKHTAYPVHWGKNQKGMQATEELSPKDQERAKNLWLAAAETAARYAQELADIGVHKQIANRLIENFQNIEVVVTSSKWANFFALRNHPDAQPEIQELAKAMLAAYRASTPRILATGELHLPFVTEAERYSGATALTLCKMSAARCARVSYLNHEGKTPTLEEDLALYDRLMSGTVKHASPTEHQAYPDEFAFSTHHGNLGFPWVQFRKTISGEKIDSYQEIVEQKQ